MSDIRVELEEKNSKHIEVQEVKRGRPKVYNYDRDEVVDHVLKQVVEKYQECGKIKTTADALGLAPLKVKKLLITAGVLEYEETKTIQRLLSYQKSINEIMKETGLSKASINSYLPYTKVPYKESEISPNAQRCKRYREKKQAQE